MSHGVCRSILCILELRVYTNSNLYGTNQWCGFQFLPTYQKRTAIAAFIPVLVLMLLFGTYLSLVTPTGTSRGNFGEYPLTSESIANFRLGLKLVVSVNSTEIPSQDTININAFVLNTRATVNNATAVNDWAMKGLSPGPCVGEDGNLAPIGFAFFRGYYDLSNISAADTPLQVWGYSTCPSIIYSERVNSYSFPPANNNTQNFGASYVDYRGFLPSGAYLQAQFVYATTASNAAPYNSLGSSLPAKYTLVAGDEWGQLAVLHFTVTQSNNLPMVGDFLAAEGSCIEDGYPIPCITYFFSDAFIFNCAFAAATQAGCTARVPSLSGSASPPILNYTITVWYPYVNKTADEPYWANCKFSVIGDTASPYGSCFMVNSTAFAMSFS